MLFKIYGERNSGTNFLTLLLEKNLVNVFDHKEVLKKNNKIAVYFWKHGYPTDVDETIEDTINNMGFIIKDTGGNITTS